mmetsp:Transcript_91724/g.239249  ORF Transcript_91724/g.239249 Transcript_91724/m.239249 type:complete len:283 (-) Transcript_91724:369-1217(-)
MPVPLRLGVAVAVAMVLLAIRVVRIPMISMASMTTGAAVPVLGLDILRFLLDVSVDEVRHVVRPHVRELRHLNATLDRRQNLGVGIDATNSVLHGDRGLRANQIQLVQQQLVAESHLLVSFVDLALLNLVVQARQNVLGVNDCDHAVEPQVRGEMLHRHEGSHDGNWVSHAGGLNHDLIDPVALLDLIKNLLQALLEIATHGAAHATVVHNHDLLRQRHLVLLQQRIIDGDLTELILDNRDLHLLLLLQNVIQESRLTCTEEACENDHRQLLVFWDLRRLVW